MVVEGKLRVRGWRGEEEVEVSRAKRKAMMAQCPRAADEKIRAACQVSRDCIHKQGPCTRGCSDRSGAGAERPWQGLARAILPSLSTFCCRCPRPTSTTSLTFNNPPIPANPLYLLPLLLYLSRALVVAILFLSSLRVCPRSADVVNSHSPVATPFVSKRAGNFQPLFRCDWQLLYSSNPLPCTSPPPCRQIWYKARRSSRRCGRRCSQSSQRRVGHRARLTILRYPTISFSWLLTGMMNRR